MNSRRRHRPLGQIRHAPPKVPPPSAARRLQCVCGKGIDVLPEHAGWRGRCPTCFRDFEILFSRDATGAAIVSLAYLTDGKAKSDTAAETSTGLISSGSTSKNAGAITEIGLKAVPEPPDEAQFRCGCGALLSITRERYDKRVKCPACGKRRLVSLAYDEASQGYTLHTFILEDRPSGGTKMGLRLS
jgi:DNA-directed RNA polymerase subunit RPC12/RpoP